MGGAIHNPQGEWVIGYTGNVYKGNLIMAELLALIQGLHIAITKKLTLLEVATDCKELIDIILLDHPLLH